MSRARESAQGTGPAILPWADIWTDSGQEAGRIEPIRGPIYSLPRRKIRIIGPSRTDLWTDSPLIGPTARGVYKTPAWTEPEPMQQEDRTQKGSAVRPPASMCSSQFLVRPRPGADAPAAGSRFDLAGMSWLAVRPVTLEPRPPPGRLVVTPTHRCRDRVGAED